MEKRNTLQKQLVLNAVREMRKHVSAEEVYEYLHEKYPSIGRATVYRNLGTLAEEKEILKIHTPSGADLFDFSLHKHFHIKCVRCGKVSDVEMKKIPDLIPEISESYGFECRDYSIFFEGLCKDCKKYK